MMFLYGGANHQDVIFDNREGEKHMFCSNCGKNLPDGAKFCGACGAPVKTAEEAARQPAAVTSEPENHPMPEQAPIPEPQKFNVQISGTAASVQKKSKKGLAVGLSVGGVLIVVIFAVALIFVFGLKSGSKGGSFVSIVNEVVYDDEYTYYLSEDDRGNTARIMRVGNDQDAEPEVLYEVDQIRGDGWGMYPLGWLFLWDDKICFLEITDASDDGDDEYDFYWISKDGKDHGTLVSYEQMSEVMDYERFGLRNIYQYGDDLIFSNGQVLKWLDLKTGEFRERDDVINADKPIHFVAYDKGYYYYFAFDVKNEAAGGTLYRKKEGSEAEKICVMPELKYTSESDHDTLSTCVPNGDYIYFADETTIFRIHMENGDVEDLASYEEAENRFAISDAGLYYFKNMSLRLIDLETLDETVFDLPEDVESLPHLIYAGPDGGCWLKRWEENFRYYRFIPDEKSGSYTYFGKKQNETKGSDQTAHAEGPVSSDITPLYADVVKKLIEEYGSISFGGGDSYECYVNGVFKIDMLDFNRDGTDELAVLYSREGEGIFPYVDVWTVKDGVAVQLFCAKPKNESHESSISLSIYENGGYYYVPIYDTLDENPVYVHLYGFDEHGTFGEIYQYENNDFYSNQLPDGMEFTPYSTTEFYFNSQHSGADEYESYKKAVEETLLEDMRNKLNILGIAMPEAPPENVYAIYEYEGNWEWKQESGDMTATLQLEATDGSTLSGTFGVYRLFSEQLTITITSANTGTVTSETVHWDGTAEFGADHILINFEDVSVLGAPSISAGFGTTEFRFTPAS